MKRREFSKLLAILGSFLTAMGLILSSAHAEEIKIFSLPGMMSAFEELGPKFEKASGHKLVATFEVNVPMMRRIDAGEKFDAVITTPEDLDGLVNRGKVISDSRLDLGRVGIAVWIRPGTPKPDISTADAFKRMLLEAKSISYTKGSAAGNYLAGLMERLGIAEQMTPKTVFFGGGGKNPRAVADGEVQYGMSIATDGVGVSGVEMLGLLPQELQKWLVFRGGVATDASDPAAARDFLKFLGSPGNASVMKAKGWESVTQ